MIHFVYIYIYVFLMYSLILIPKKLLLFSFFYHFDCSKALCSFPFEPLQWVSLCSLSTEVPSCIAITSVEGGEKMLLLSLSFLVSSKDTAPP